MNLVDFTASPIPRIEDIAVRMNGPIPEAPPDLIPGLMPMKGQMIIAGETNVGKSLTALEICSSLSTGSRLWGELEPVQKATKILYVLAEHSADVIQRLAAVTKLPFSDNVLLIGPDQIGIDKYLVSRGAHNMAVVNRFMRWCEGCDLVVWDPLSAFLTGSDNAENDNVQMRLVLDVMGRICGAAGAACLVVAHQGKPMMDKFGNEHARTKYAIRGASGIEDAATNIFYLGVAKGESEAAQKIDGDIFSLTCRKYKGPAPAEYRLLRDPHTLTHTLLGNRPFVEVQKLAGQAMVGKIQTAFPSLSNSMVLDIVAMAKGCSPDTIRRWLK